MASSQYQAITNILSFFCFVCLFVFCLNRRCSFIICSVLQIIFGLCICPFFGHCIVCPSIYGFPYGIFKLSPYKVLGNMLHLSMQDYFCFELCPFLCSLYCLFFYLRLLLWCLETFLHLTSIFFFFSINFNFTIFVLHCVIRLQGLGG